MNYQYDAANRLTSLDGVSYSWDNNGNLLTDGTSVYSYNYANMLASVSQGGVVYDYLYSGLGDRLQQAIDGVPTNYTLDINTRLTQVLVDGEHLYLYGLGRIAQEGTDAEYFLEDALTSVRQLVDGAVDVTLTQSYEPFGSVLVREGGGKSVFQYTGEFQDEFTQLTYLRSRFMSNGVGRFISKDVWDGNFSIPMSQNTWLYGYANPITYLDPTGLASTAEARLDEIIEEAKKNGAYRGAESLFRSFEDDDLYTVWGHEAGRTLQERLMWLLEVTAGYKGLSDPLAQALGFQFGKPFGLDCDFAEQFRDSQFYLEYWDEKPESSNQAGHFLSAVSLTYRFIIPWESSYENPYTNHHSILPLVGISALRMIVGHEKRPDDLYEGGLVANVKIALAHMNSATMKDLNNWYRAVEYDSAGKYNQRDIELWDILQFGIETPFGMADQDRKGNSLQDLRLSLKGYRFAWYVHQNKDIHPAYGGYWLRSNLSIGSGLMYPLAP